MGKAWKVFSYTVQTFWKGDGIFIIIISFYHCYNTSSLSFSWYTVSKGHQPLFSVCREPWTRRRLGVYMPKWSERMQREYISSMSSNVAYKSSRFQTTGSSGALYHVVVVWCLSIVWFNNKIQNYRSIRNARLCDNKGTYNLPFSWLGVYLYITTE